MGALSLSDKYGNAARYTRRHVVPKPAAFVYWIVRDRNLEGELFDFVLVWYAEPTRYIVGPGVEWRRLPDGLNEYVGSLWPVDAFRLFGTVPEDDLEMIKVERNKMLSFDPRHGRKK